MIDLKNETLLEKLLEIADKLCDTAKNTYNSEGLKLTELLIAIKEYEIAKKSYIDDLERRFVEFEKYFDS